jgi:hypothetical protein
VPGLEAAYAAGWVTQDAPHAPEAGSRPGPAGSGRGGVAAPPATPPPGPPPPLLRSITLVAYPGDTADLAALPGLGRVYPHDLMVLRTTVGGRPARVIETGSSEFRIYRTVLTHAPWGDLLMAGGSGTPAEVPTVEQLTALLASARAATPAEWATFVAASTSA